MNTVIVVGPQGCGKTRNAQALVQRLGCRGIVDDWVPGVALVPGALHLTHEAVTAEQARGSCVKHFSPRLLAGKARA